MEIIEECEELLKFLSNHREIIDETLENTQTNKNQIRKVSNEKHRRKSFVELNRQEQQTIANLTKLKKGHFRLIYITGAIPYLDLKTILNISLLNKEFNSYLNSIFTISKLTKKKNKPIFTDTPIKSKKEGYLSKLTGALSFLNFSTEKETSRKPIDPKLLAEKVDIYEKILLKKLEVANNSKLIQTIRKQIDETISLRHRKTDIKSFHTERDLLMIKNDNLEYEFNELAKEVISLNEEVMLFKFRWKPLIRILIP